MATSSMGCCNVAKRIKTRSITLIALQSSIASLTGPGSIRKTYGLHSGPFPLPLPQSQFFQKTRIFRTWEMCQVQRLLRFTLLGYTNPLSVPPSKILAVHFYHFLFPLGSGLGRELINFTFGLSLSRLRLRRKQSVRSVKV